jgi:hypothetical protein
MGKGAARGAAGEGARRSRAHLAGAALLALLAGASSARCHRVFTCVDATQCSHDGVAGTCEDDGYCSFPDGECASGRRYGDHAAAGVAGACVPAGDEPPVGTTEAANDGSSAADPTATTSGTGSDDGSSTGIAGEDTSLDPCDGLRPSGAVEAVADGEVIAGLRIDVDAGPGIDVDGLAGVTIRDCEIHHRGGPGIAFRAAPDLRIENVIVVHDGAPEAGPHPDGDQVNIEGRDSTGVVIDRVRLERGSSGIVLESTPAAVVSNLEMHDVRGPGPIAACVRLFDSDDAIVEDFSCENPLDTGRPGDLISVEASSDVTIRRGLLDGHNAEFGVGVRITHTAGQHSGGLVEDVDAIRMTNGAFSCFQFGQFITFRRTRARENICEILSVPIEGCLIPGPNGGCVPNSNAVSWTASDSSHDNVLDDAVAFDLCAAAVWPQAPDEGAFIIGRGDLVTEDFVLRDPIRLSMCWEAG